jgi:hypothetical protein
MLYFVDKNGKEKTWHVGSPIPQMENVVEVQVDGDELTYIEMNFGNIPISRKKQVVKWTGDFALFIYNNLS